MYVQIACNAIYDEEDRNVNIWGKAHVHEKFFGVPLDRESTKRELIEMDTAKAAKKHPEFYSRVMGKSAQDFMLLGEGHDIARPIEYFITDMFAVGLEAFKDREDDKLFTNMHGAHIPRLTSVEVTDMGVYLAQQVHASCDSVSYMLYYGHHHDFLSVELCVANGTRSTVCC